MPLNTLWFIGSFQERLEGRSIDRGDRDSSRHPNPDGFSVDYSGVTASRSVQPMAADWPVLIRSRPRLRRDRDDGHSRDLQREPGRHQLLELASSSQTRGHWKAQRNAPAPVERQGRGDNGSRQSCDCYGTLQSSVHRGARSPDASILPNKEIRR
jgi:hypothetical protein